MGKLDASIKHAFVVHPKDWATFVGASSSATVEAVDSDLATASFAADKVLKVSGPTTYILHLEPQGYYDEEIDARMHSYHALLRRRHGVFVHSTVLALHRGAWGARNLGRVRERSPIGGCKVDFTYDVIRVWELPVESILSAGVGVLPLAPIANVSEASLPPVIEQMAKRFEREVPRAEAAELWTATMLLLGLKFDTALAHVLLRGVHHIMHESSTYQAIIEEGERKGERRGEIKGKRDALLIIAGRRAVRRAGRRDSRSNRKDCEY